MKRNIKKQKFLQKNLQKYFAEFLGKSYEESTFKDIENQIRIELNDLIEEKKRLKRMELNQDLLKIS